jgi:hypothetical protein
LDMGCLWIFVFSPEEEIGKVVRVVEGAALEMLYRSNPIVGSNPTSSVGL